MNAKSLRTFIFKIKGKMKEYKQKLELLKTACIHLQKGGDVYKGQRDQWRDSFKVVQDELNKCKERALFWENTGKNAVAAEEYYREELAKAHTLLGRVIHQTSERWDAVNLTKYFPTNNLHKTKTSSNPKGDKR